MLDGGRHYRRHGRLAFDDTEADGREHCAHDDGDASADDRLAKRVAVALLAARLFLTRAEFPVWRNQRYAEADHGGPDADQKRHDDVAREFA
jgi:hypothetical protein